MSHVSLTWANKVVGSDIACSPLVGILSAMEEEVCAKEKVACSLEYLVTVFCAVPVVAKRTSGTYSASRATMFPGCVDLSDGYYRFAVLPLLCAVL